ncbi:hypothetical protein GLW03_12950 [Halobacillus halophilus]|nr:hypothetical protein [Halobacillus halophilus]MYL30734.1 hypothetical protein [Halobacillus halophilus]
MNGYDYEKLVKIFIRMYEETSDQKEREQIVKLTKKMMEKEIEQNG